MLDRDTFTRILAPMGIAMQQAKTNEARGFGGGGLRRSQSAAALGAALRCCRRGRRCRPYQAGPMAQSLVPCE